MVDFVSNVDDGGSEHGDSNDDVTCTDSVGIATAAIVAGNDAEKRLPPSVLLALDTMTDGVDKNMQHFVDNDDRQLTGL